MAESDLQAGLEVLGLVYEEPQRLLMAMEEDVPPKMAMMQQLVKALEDDYTELKGSQYLLKCQTPMKGHGREKHINQHPHQLQGSPHSLG